jgi:type II protein arginine methyltransferase
LTEPARADPAIEALLAAAEGRPDAMLALAPQLDPARALATIERALALAPDDPALRARGRRLLSRLAPSWHFVIVRDRRRNAAYEAALRRAVTPGDRVLDIGTGSGLLAMMAARAGAREVIACEANPAIAETAREIIAHNGFADRVRIVAKHSTALDALADLGGRADVVVSEIVSNDLIGEAVLPTLEDAVRRLIKPGAAVIPARGRIRAALGHDAGWAGGRMDAAEGLDLSPFNRFAPALRETGVGDARLTLRSEAADLFDFDFAAGGPYPSADARLSLRSQGGTVNCIAQWLALDLDAATTYENPPHGEASCWAVVIHPLETELATEAGEPVVVGARHDRRSVWLWVEA